MRVLLVYIVIVAIGQVISVLIGLAIDPFSKTASLAVFIPTYYAMYWIAWRITLHDRRPVGQGRTGLGRRRWRHAGQGGDVAARAGRRGCGDLRLSCRNTAIPRRFWRQSAASVQSRAMLAIARDRGGEIEQRLVAAAQPMNDSPTGQPATVPTGIDTCGRPPRPAMQVSRITWVR